MTKSFRKKLFIFFVLIFVVSGVFLILYSNGYRLDVNSISIKKTGGLFLKIKPKDADIYLNDKKIKGSKTVVKNGILVKNLIPKQYRLKIEKDGYYDYYKNITIKPSEVTKLSNVILIPTDIKPDLVSTDVSGDEITEISRNEKNIITYDTETDTYYYCTISKISICQNISSKIKALIKESAEKVFLYPSENESFLVTTKDAIYKVNLSDSSAKKVLEGSFNNISLNNNDLYFTSINKDSSDTEITIYDLQLGQIINNIKIPFQIDKIKSIERGLNNYISILLESGELFTFNISANKLNIVDSNINTSLFSPDGSKIIYKTNNGEIYVYMLEDDILVLNSKKGDKIKIWLSDSKSVSKIDWFDSYHLITTYPNEVLFSEVDYMAYNNQYKIASIEDGDSILFSKKSGKLYIKNDSSISVYKIDVK